MKLRIVAQIAFIVILLCQFAASQKIDLTKLKGMSVRNIGPAGMSGRVTAIDVDKKNNIIYIGTASGGVWASLNGGISWKPIFDDQPTQSIGCIKVNQRNPDEIWVGTGEGNPRNSHNAGQGIFHSLDGGKTWACMGLKQSRLIHRILIDADDPATVYAGVLGPAWGPGTERGVYKTRDGGKTWSRSLFVNDSTGVGEMVMDPQNPKKLIVNMWQFYRTPWQMKSGGAGSGLYITYDGGEHWKKLTTSNGLPEGYLGRCGLAISNSNPKVIYALIEAKENALYRSENGGENFYKVAEDKGFNSRPFYFYEIYVDPASENVIYSLHTYLVKSIDGGKTYKNIADYGNAVHPDHHAFWIDPSNPDYLLDGNDGGLNVSKDGGKTWQFILNLPVGQFYHLNVDQQFPYRVYGGMQDNGSWVGQGFTLSYGGIRNADWQEVYFGDGFDVAPVRSNFRYGYAMSQGGDLCKYDLETGRTENIRPVHPNGMQLRFNWNAGLALDPIQPHGVYYGSQFLHYSDNEGASWKIISPDLTTNDSLKRPEQSGGLTPDVTGAENYTTIIAIAPSPVNKNVIWVGTDDGNVQLTTDGGASWKNLIEQIKGAPKGAWVPQIEVSPTNAAQAFVVINNYRRNDYKPYLFFTSDYGKTWADLITPDIKGFVTCIVQDPKQPDLLFLGADDGLYISFDFGKNWNHWTNDFPQVQIQDMKIQEQFSDLVMATFGRAFWVMDNIEPLRKIAATRGEIIKQELALVSAPDAYNLNYKSFAGTRFYAQGDFNGANRNLGSQFWIHTNMVPNVKDSGDAKKAKIRIVALDGRLIRNYKAELKDTGLQVIYWGLETNGLRIPSKAEPKSGDDLPAGPKALPGTYKIYIQWKSRQDSAFFAVHADPRSPVTANDEMQHNEMLQQLRIDADSLAKLYDAVREAKRSMDLVEKLAFLKEDSIKNKIVKLSEVPRKKITEIEDKLFGTEGTKGIERDQETVLSDIYSSISYAESSGIVPSQNASDKIRLTRSKIHLLYRQVKDFMDVDYAAYRSGVSNYALSPFK
ncbi:MAG: hypothetical protein U0V49_13025 [Saprospiraceae bacterium]